MLGVPIRTVSPSHALLSTPTWPNGLEPEPLIAALGIGDELERLVPSAHPPQETTTLATPIGVSYAAVPIRSASQEALAYYVVGPMLVGPREDEARFRQRITAMGRDPAGLWALLLSLKLHSFVALRGALSLLEEVGGTMVQLAEDAARRTAKGGAGIGGEQRITAAGPDEICQAILDAALLATHADGGSLMLFDRIRGALTIRAAQGLSPSVVASAAVKPGEGLAGLAVAQRRTLVVDAQAEGPVKSRMQRAHLRASLVVPLAPDAQGQPIGVLNLWILDPGRQFPPDHAALLRALLTLASFALA